MYGNLFHSEIDLKITTFFHGISSWSQNHNLAPLSCFMILSVLGKMFLSEGKF